MAWAVNISQNVEMALAALSDGTIRWYRMRDGREVISFFAHANGVDWMAWTPDGYYTSMVKVAATLGGASAGGAMDAIWRKVSATTSGL